MRFVFFALAVSLVLPSAAKAKSFRGETSQKRYASVVVGDDGYVTRVRISYSAPCGDPRYRFANVLRLEPPYEKSTQDELSQTLDLSDRLSGGGMSHQTVKVTARRSVGDDGIEVWNGTFATRTVLRRDGKRIDTCRLKRVTWTASAIG